MGARIGGDFGTTPVTFLREVTANSPAATAGLEPGDRVVSDDGHVLRTPVDWLLFRANVEINRPLQLEVERRGKQALLTLKRRLWAYLTLTNRLLFFVETGVSLLQLILAFVVALSSPRDRVALLGVWLLAGRATFDFDILKGRFATWRQLPAVRWLPLWIPYFSSSYVVGSICFSFFANFPRKLFHVRWAWVLVWLPSLVGLALSVPWLYQIVYDPIISPAKV